jgi:hypothetical protein
MSIQPEVFLQGVANHGGWYVAVTVIPTLIVAIVAQFFLGKYERERRESEIAVERKEWALTELDLMNRIQKANEAHLKTLSSGPQIEHLTQLANLLLGSRARTTKNDRNDDVEG